MNVDFMRNGGIDRRSVLTLINEGQADPEVRRRMDEFGLSCDITDLAACEAEVRAERERWTEYTRVAGIQPE